jgi:hypothetical protein
MNAVDAARAREKAWEQIRKKREEEKPASDGSDNSSEK